MKLVCLLFVVVYCCPPSTQAQQNVIYYVAPTGSDRNPGTLNKPFASPERARDVIRLVRIKQPNTACQVQLRGGTYYRKNTFDLIAADSNTTYQAYKDEKVIWHGGRLVPASLFSLCTDPAVLKRLRPEASGKVYVADLGKAGLTDLGRLTQKGFGTPVSPAQVELFLNGKPLHLARYPNPGEPTLKIGRVYDPGAKPRYGDFSGRGAVFGYEYDRPARWQQADEIWLHGKFSFGYADDHLKVERLDTDKKTLKMAFAHLYGVFSTLYPDTTKWQEREGTAVRGYYAYNLLEELDQPGEYYLDRKTNRVYLFAEQPLTDATLEMSLLEDPLVRITNTQRVGLKGIAFTCSRGLGIYQERTHDVVVDHCQFSNLGTAGISLGQPFQHTKITYRADGSPETETELNADFSNNRIINCTFFDLGTGGVFVTGGNRKTLQSANNQVVNCEFYRIDRIRETYSGGVTVKGVGGIVRNCYFHDIKHLALAFTGNNHQIEYNHFDRVCTDADDMGAIYTGRNPSARGTVIQYNYFSNIEPQNKETKMCGIYFDDGCGGMTIRNNLFYKTGNRGKKNDFGAVFFHAGFDNQVINNLFLHCDMGVGHAPWSQKRFSDWLQSPLLQQRLTQEVDISSEVYRQTYPELNNYFQDQGLRLNYVTGNLFINTIPFLKGDYKADRNNALITSTAIRPEQLDFRQLAAQMSGIKTFPFEKVGVHARTE